MGLPARSAGHDPEELSRAFAAALGAGRASPLPGALAGIEHEYEVFREGAKLDFRALIHSLSLDGARLDPGDPNAYRCAWGGVITADGREAEIATPALERRPGSTHALAGVAHAGRRALEAALPPGLVLRGYSTHVNVSMPARYNDAVALLYVQTFAPALMLLMDRRTSPGLLVRPRPGRIELGGEFVDGARLAAVISFAIASVRATADAVIRRAPVPEPLRVVIEPGAERFGWYVDRDAFGSDLYARGRAARLRTVRGRVVRAQERLEQAWEVARPYVTDEVDAAWLQRVTFGGMSLPFDDADPDPTPIEQSVASGAPVPREVARPSFTVAPVAATWEHTVYEIRGRRRAFAYIPREALDPFQEMLARGTLDQIVESYLAGPSQRRVLRELGDTTTATLYDGVRPLRATMYARERAPIASARAVSGVIAQAIAVGMPVLSPKVRTRPGKSTPVDVAWRLPGWAWGAIIAVILAIIGAVTMFGGGSPAPVPTPTASTSTSLSTIAASPPVMQPISAQFVQADFATYYTAVATDPSGAPLTFRWTLSPPPGDPTCRKFAPLDPPMRSPNRAKWRHNGDADGCSHSTQQSGPLGHLGTITVTVSNDAWICTARYVGSETGKGTKPSCARR